jgi:tRNA (guanine-N7-)-methyltransferase
MPATANGKRTIRSFVRRTGRMTPGQARALRELWPTFGVDLDGTMLDLDRIFARSADNVLEIGFGNGASLVQLAKENPQLDFLGIEVHEPGVGHCLMSAQDGGVTNLKVIVHDALEVLELLRDGSLSRINLLFPDPWPKKRHHKRRIFQQAFLGLAAAKLRGGGALYIATDWQNYAEHIDALIARTPEFSVVERREHAGDQPLARPATKFETRGINKGHRICDWQLLRRQPGIHC